MKNIIITCCALPLFVASYAKAGINGTYKVRGTESNDGEKLTFTGTVKVSQYKIGSIHCILRATTTTPRLVSNSARL